MMEDQQYYSLSGYARTDGEGQVKLHLYVSINEPKAEFSNLLCKSVDELEQLRAKSKAEESAAVKALETSVGQEWAEKAAHTMLIKKALEYVRTSPVKHTGNVWRESSEHAGFFEISNMVYKMTYHVYVKTSYISKKEVPVAWEITWSVRFNAPQGYYDRTSISAIIAGQDRKRYSDKDSADKYLQGRIAAYAHLFTEISPPIPEEKAKLFCVNGILLPGYIVAAHEPTPDELLDFLDEGDVSHAEIKTPPSKEKNRTPPKKPGKRR